MLGDAIGPLANPMTDIKASEGESPIPLDRVFYRFNLTFGATFEFFHHSTLGLGFVVPTVGPRRSPPSSWRN
jgi:hypothetical protein